MSKGGQLFIVSGPSGAGKTALAKAVLRSLPDLKFSVSYTTRPARGEERDGVEYHFVDRDSFFRLVEAGEFLERAEVYGNLYGTSAREVEDILAGGDDVLLDVDVQGAKSIRVRRPDAVAIFIMPPSYQVLRERLEARCEDRTYVIEQRLKIAASEVVQFVGYDYLIVNLDIARALEELEAIIMGCRCLLPQRFAAAEAIVTTFGGVDEENAGKR